MATVTFRLRNKVTGQTSAPVSVNYTVRSLLMGMDAPNGAEFKAAVANYLGMLYTRDYGRDGDDLDTLPEPSTHGAGKLADAPADCVIHESWKDDPGLLSAWLDGVKRPYYLTWYHEAHDRVAPADYRAAGAQWSKIIAGHPNGHWILGHGPIVTRYWLDERKGNPTDFGYPGMTHYGIDCYQNTPTAAAYWGVEKMFGVGFGKVRAAYPGIRLWVPEYGIARLDSDRTGAGRAQAIRDHITWLRTQADVDAVAYFNNQADFPQYAFASTSPEGLAWRELQAA